MKLYTEEQVKIAYSKGNNDGYCRIQRDFIGLNLMPIKLPSDEEIANNLILAIDGLGEPEHRKICFIGALWMKDQILNQNK
jgi:hypothetical protein